jgi:hypothetical protein
LLCLISFMCVVFWLADLLSIFCSDLLSVYRKFDL